MPGTIIEIAQKVDSIGSAVKESSNILSELRQFSHAEVVSVSEDFATCDIVLLKNRQGIEGASIVTHPNDLNILGYPKVGDIVLVYHQREHQDCHVLMRLHSKVKAFYKYECMANNSTQPSGALMG